MLRLLFIAAFLAPHAFAEGGGNDGGNCVSDSQHPAEPCKAVEEFHRKPETLSEIKGYKIFKDRLEEIRKELPDLADALENGLKNKSIYHIPQQFDVLSSEKTKLQFSSKQPAYQNDREIFFSKLGLANMNEESAANIILHEAAMGMQSKRDVSKVRTLTAALIEKPFNAIHAQDVAASNGFGAYFTPEQKELHKEQIHKSYSNFLTLVLENAAKRCEEEKYKFADVARVLHCAPGASDCDSAGMYGPHQFWTSPFSPPGLASPVAAKSHMHMVMTISEDTSSDHAKKFGAYNEEAGETASSALFDFSARTMAQKFSKERAETSSLFKTMYAFSDEARLAVRKELSALENDPAFIRLSASVGVAPKEVVENNLKSPKPYQKWVGKIEERVLSQSKYSYNNKKAICDDVKAILKKQKRPEDAPPFTAPPEPPKSGEPSGSTRPAN